jgi:hypothetical protein
MHRILKPFFRIIQLFITIGFLCSLIAACQGEDTQVLSTASPTVTSIPTLIPTPTPLIQKVFLIVPDGASLALSESIHSTLQELVGPTGMEVVLKDRFSAEDVDSSLRIVVALPHTEDLEGMVESYPDIQFIAVGIPGLQARSNLSLIGPDGFRNDQQAFLAGYIAAVITKDWRIGMISLTSSDALQSIETGFENGVIFYCGLCRPTYPPFQSYPINLHLTEQPSTSEWLEAFSTLNSYSVTTIALLTEELQSSLIDTIIEQDITLIGVQSPPQELTGSWASTIRFTPEEPLKEHWQETLSSQGGWVEPIPFRLEDINETIFSEGRQRWVSYVLDDLVDGYIDTGVSSAGTP